jgi:hypothetical protein
VIRIDFDKIVFGDPRYLWLLIVPALLVAAWAWRFSKRRADTRRLAERRTVPIRERFALAGDLPFWLCLIAATACLIIALARPRAPATAERRGGIDMVILQDGSASMYVKDVGGDRWQRSMRFLRLLGDSLSWTNDRIAMALFAHIAAPQVRLTKDPNTFFFFLDHLEQQSPFRLEDDPTWDTNLELGVYWGLRVIEKDEELHGRSPNAKMFVMLTDGETWSGEVAKSLKRATERRIPMFVVGVGTLAGGLLPVVKGIEKEEQPPPLISRHGPPHRQHNHRCRPAPRTLARRRRTARGSLLAVSLCCGHLRDRGSALSAGASGALDAVGRSGGHDAGRVAVSLVAGGRAMRRILIGATLGGVVAMGALALAQGTRLLSPAGSAATQVGGKWYQDRSDEMFYAGGKWIEVMGQGHCHRGVSDGDVGAPVQVREAVKRRASIRYLRTL